MLLTSYVSLLIFYLIDLLRIPIQHSLASLQSPNWGKPGLQQSQMKDYTFNSSFVHVVENGTTFFSCDIGLEQSIYCLKVSVSKKKQASFPISIGASRLQAFSGSTLGCVKHNRDLHNASLTLFFSQFQELLLMYILFSTLQSFCIFFFNLKGRTKERKRKQLSTHWLVKKMP